MLNLLISLIWNLQSFKNLNAERTILKAIQVPDCPTPEAPIVIQCLDTLFLSLIVGIVFSLSPR